MKRLLKGYCSVEYRSYYEQLRHTNLDLHLEKMPILKSIPLLSEAVTLDLDRQLQCSIVRPFISTKMPLNVSSPPQTNYLGNYSRKYFCRCKVRS